MGTDSSTCLSFKEPRRACSMRAIFLTRDRSSIPDRLPEFCFSRTGGLHHLSKLFAEVGRSWLQRATSPKTRCSRRSNPPPTSRSNPPITKEEHPDARTARRNCQDGGHRRNGNS